MINKELKDIHSVLLEMLCWFHQCCVEHGFRYYIIGGTMLGAVRHKGFIPWDDDIDVAMPRKDYTEFMERFLKKSSSPYAVEYPHEGNLDYKYLFGKVYDTRTLLHENKRYPIKRGVYIDVFPLDGIGDTYESACRNYQPILNTIRLHDMATCAFRSGRKWYKNMSLVFGRIVSPLFLSERFINNKVNRMCAARDFDHSEYVGNLIGNWGMKEIMHRSYFGAPTEYSFEGCPVWGVEKPHEYLQSLYRDYMKLPPKEKQISHHDYVKLDLTQSYLK